MTSGRARPKTALRTAVSKELPTVEPAALSLNHPVRQLREGPDDEDRDGECGGQPDGRRQRQPVPYPPDYLTANLEQRSEHVKHSIRWTGKNGDRPHDAGRGQRSSRTWLAPLTAELVPKGVVAHTLAVGRDTVSRGV